MTSRYPTALIYHGPSARDRAITKALDMGVLVVDPVGDDGLKIDDARSVVERLSQPAVGDRIGCVVIGPLDRARPQASDALLKSLEEFDPSIVRPVLWADDIGDVSSTVRSRCHAVWCPGEELHDEGVLDLARDLIQASLEGDRPLVIEKWKDADHEALLAATGKVLQPFVHEKKAARLWDRVRTVLRHRNPTKYEVLAVFL